MMSVGVLTDCSCVLVGGLLGTVLGSRFTPALREKLTMVLGFASMAIGINSIVKANQMTPVVIAVIFGTLLGELLHLEEHITHVFGAVTRKLPHDEANFDMERYITVVVLFCASGFGIYGVLVEGMSGSPAVLQSKAMLDLCTAAVFAVTLGVAVAVIALPMLAVMLALFFAAGAIAPFVTPEMLQDFISCGGVLTIVAGMRVSGIKQYPIANMIPALLDFIVTLPSLLYLMAVSGAEWMVGMPFLRLIPTAMQVCYVLNFIQMVIRGLFAVYWYKKESERRIHRVYDRCPEGPQRSNALAATGGTSWAAVFIYLGVYIAAGVLGSFLMGPDLNAVIRFLTM